MRECELFCFVVFEFVGVVCVFVFVFYFFVLWWLIAANRYRIPSCGVMLCCWHDMI